MPSEEDAGTLKSPRQLMGKILLKGKVVLHQHPSAGSGEQQRPEADRGLRRSSSLGELLAANPALLDLEHSTSSREMTISPAHRNSQPAFASSSADNERSPSCHGSRRSSCNSSATIEEDHELGAADPCLLYTSPSPRDQRGSRMPSSA